MSQPVVVVDDQSGDSALDYEGEWSHLYGSGTAVNGTLSYTIQAGNTITFKFNGTGVGVIGALPPTSGSAGAVTSYAVDDASPVVFTAPSDLTSTVYGQTFFQQQSLSGYHEHTLVINVTYASVEAAFLFDYVGYVCIPTARTNGLSFTSFPSPTRVAQWESSKTTSPVGAIVGGVIGGLAFLVILTLVVLFLRRRRPRRSPRSLNLEDETGLAGPKSPVPPPASLMAPTLSTPPATVISSNLRTTSLAREAHIPAQPPEPQPLPHRDMEPDVFSDVPDEVPPEYTEL
ncbi:hypothetical protein PsYK624_041440 [Phanerochaete sordida]|uniref:Transmembrane protein n=1 Tax=Phanerochaete sordida TaxID=48140 RepID=A0A9P3LA67_9APHY|nr:hypothetical protein PsYK624_041440 [Phanerochaete sordida]